MSGLKDFTRRLFGSGTESESDRLVPIASPPSAEAARDWQEALAERGIPSTLDAPADDLAADADDDAEGDIFGQEIEAGGEADAQDYDALYVAESQAEEAWEVLQPFLVAQEDGDEGYLCGGCGERFETPQMAHPDMHDCDVMQIPRSWGGGGV